jgi:sarcosine oxidase delta subunit
VQDEGIIGIVQKVTKHERIKKKAYEIYLWRERHNLKGTAEEDWLEAKQEINDEGDNG